ASGAQAPATQRAYLQAVSPELSQSESARHCTQAPVASHSLPPFSLQVVRAVYPHVPWTQLRTRQAVSLPGQSVPIRHPTHCPFASQKLSPPQEVIAVSGACDGVPPVQTSVVHGLRSLGRSVSSL